MSMKKFDNLTERLISKIKMSQVPVPGFVIGMSGTDSMVAFALCKIAAYECGITNVRAIHYGKPSRFTDECETWLLTEHKTKLDIWLPRSDEERWAAIHMLAKEYGLWTVGTLNATEKELGKYSMLSKSVSVQPIQSLWKSEILEIAKGLHIPKATIDRARIPDCLCGRDDFMADNIELIDYCLSYGKIPLPYGETLDSLKQAMDYIRSTKSDEGYHGRTPYIL